MDCANCRKKECYEGKDCSGITEEVADHYLADKGDLEIARVASFVEARFYRKLTRLEELINFSKEMNYTKLGIAFCIGLSEEAEVLQKILEEEGFKISSVCCKVCGILKERLELEKIEKGREDS